MAARELATVVRQLVDHPELVEVRELQRGRLHVLEVTVAEGDMGSVIGRHGRTAQALRSLLRTRGDAAGVSYDLKIRGQGEA
jgi:predicted RNA-binding protein YlqC (UPF0109 family)